VIPPDALLREVHRRACAEIRRVFPSGFGLVAYPPILGRGGNVKVSDLNHRGAYLFDRIPEFAHHAMQVETGVLIL